MSDKSINDRDSITPSKVASYLKAKVSHVVQGDVPPHVFQERKDSCLSCSFLVVDKADEIGYCGKCGCGRREGARLTNKLKMPKVTCPEGRWQEFKGQKS